MKWSLILLSYASLFALGLGDNIRGPSFSEILKDFNITNSVGSWMFATTSFMGIWGSFTSHHYLKKLSRVQTLQISLVLFASGLFAMGWAPQFWILLIGAGICGYAVGLMGVIQNVLATIGASDKHQNQVMAGLHAMYGLASLIAPMLVAFLTPRFGWRGSFLLASSVPTLLLLYSFIQDRSDAEHIDPKISKTKKAEFKKDSDFVLSSSSSISEKRKSSKTLNLDFVYLSAALAAYVVVEIMISSRLAHFLREVYFYPLSEAALYVTYFFCFLLAGRLLFTVYKPKLSIPWQLLAMLISTGVLIVLGLLGHPFLFCLTGFTMAAFYPMSVVYIANSFPENLDKVMSFSMTLQSCLLVVMQFSIGLISDRFGISKSFYLGIVFVFLSLACLGVFEWRRRQEQT